ncbi:hypothetical protein HY633_00245 [Candidatus Uhrbacteria bacterium]|nr:hypothetical protein [Candidatus Uhrbacteria bacterium]
MFLAVHASVGAITGNVAPDPISAFTIGFLSHFLVDMIPHGDEYMYEGYKNGARVRRAILYVACDVVATLVLVALLFIEQDFFSTRNVALGIIGGLLPDLLVGIHELRTTRLLREFHRFHMRNHHFLIKHLRKFERDIPMRYGLLLQGVVLTLLVRVVL